jgi:hypothetical protein
MAMPASYVILERTHDWWGIMGWPGELETMHRICLTLSAMCAKVPLI